MPTVIDSLSLELGWDVRAFLEGAKQTEQVVRQRRDDFERSWKIWEYVLGNLTGLLTKVVAGFLSVEAAIKGLETSKTISQIGAEMANFAQAVGMTVPQLAQWEQALARVGGRAEDVRSAFQFQQREFQQAKLGKQSAPFVSTGGFGYMQRLGLPDWRSYLDASTGAFDLDRFNKDLADATERERKRQGLTPEAYAPTRAEYLRAFGWPGTAAQALLGPGLREQLRATAPTVPTRANEEAWRELTRLWTQLGNSVDKVKNDLVTLFEEPVAHVLKSVTEVMRLLDRDQGREGPAALWAEVNRQAGSESFWQFWFAPHVYEHGQGRPMTWREWLGLPPPAAAPGAPPPSSAQSLLRASAPLVMTPGGAAMVGPRSGVRAPSPAVPYAPPVMEPGPHVPSAEPGSAAVPNLPPAQSDPAFGDYLRRRFGPRRSSGPDFMTTPMAAAAFHAETGGKTTVHNNVSTSIGGMTFVSRAADTAMGHAPAGIAKDLSVGSYAVIANESLE